MQRRRRRERGGGGGGGEEQTCSVTWSCKQSLCIIITCVNVSKAPIGREVGGRYVAIAAQTRRKLCLEEDNNQWKNVNSSVLLQHVHVHVHMYTQSCTHTCVHVHVHVYMYTYTVWVSIKFPFHVY